MDVFVVVGANDWIYEGYSQPTVIGVYNSEEKARNAIEQLNFEKHGLHQDVAEVIYYKKTLE